MKTNNRREAERVTRVTEGDKSDATKRRGRKWKGSMLGRRVTAL